MPRKTHADRLFEMGAIDATVHSMLKTEEARRKEAKAKDAARIAAAAIAKAMRPNDRVEGRDAALSRCVPSHDGLAGSGPTE